MTDWKPIFWPEPASPGKADEGQPAELVFLLKDLIPMDVHFVADAVRNVFGVSLETEEAEAEEFVTGQFPFFFVQLQGRLLQVKSMPGSYFDPETRPFVNGDPEMILRRVRDPKLRKRIDRHGAWLSVALMNAPAGAADGWAYVARMLSAFGLFGAKVILRPGNGQICVFRDYAMQDLLEEGRIDEIFGS